jgi:hypothetical protein
MEHIDDILKESKELLTSIHKKESQQEQVGTIDVFRSKLLNFINSQLEPIKRTQDMLDLVDAAIVRKLAYEEYDKNELLDVRRELTQSANLRTSVLLDPFKPTNGGGNTLITPPSADQSNNNDDVLKKLKPEERVAIEKLYAVLTMKEREKKKIVPEDRGDEL